MCFHAKYTALGLIGLFGILGAGCGPTQSPEPNAGPAKTSQADSSVVRTAKLASPLDGEWLVPYGEGSWDKGVEVSFGGQKATLALWSEGPYTTSNTGESDYPFDNTSTPIAVLREGQTKLRNNDVWMSNLPIRIGDQMIRVTKIAPDGSSLEIRKEEGPKTGLVVGYAAPDAELEDLQGTKFRLTDTADKLELIQVYSYT